MLINLKELSKRYGYSETYFRTILCRSEFNQFRIDKFFIFDNSDNFHKMLKYIIKIKKNSYSDWRLKSILFLFLLLNTQIAWCQRYEPVIIYSPSGEPQTMIKGKIIYDNYGVPKFNIQAKTGLPSIRKK